MDSRDSSDKSGSASSHILRIDEKVVRSHIEETVKRTVEETLNALLDAEADRLCNAKRYERTPDRVDTRAGSYQRKLQTRVGTVTLKMPKLRTLPFETQIIERYRRRETSVEEALMEIVPGGLECPSNRG